MSAPVVFVAPGAGLGHLLRCAGLARRLRARGLPARVLTDSPFAPGVAARLEVPVTRVGPRRWAGHAAARCRELAPRLVVLDAFPGGLRGEWAGEVPRAPVVHLARRLRWGAYRDHAAPLPARGTVLLEPLEPAHRAWLEEAGGDLVELPGRVRPPAGGPAPVLPARLAELLDGGAPLVVHSGPPAEVRALVAAARAGGPGDAPVAVVHPLPAALPDLEAFEVFPAAALYPRAARVVTAGGYHCVAEGAGLGTRHLGVALPRTWDDQAARLREPWAGPDGGPAAAAALAGWAGGSPAG